MKKHRWAVCAATLLTAFTLYLSLDTFVISRSYDANATEMNLALFEMLPDSSETEDEPGSGWPDAENQTQEPVSSGSSGGNAGTRESSRSSPRRRKSQTSPGQNSTENGISPGDSGLGTAGSGTVLNTVKTDQYSITLSEFYQNNTRIYVADVILTSSQSLRTAFANNTYGKNVTATTSSMAKNNNAILAVNGDYYGV